MHSTGKTDVVEWKKEKIETCDQETTTDLKVLNSQPTQTEHHEMSSVLVQTVDKAKAVLAELSTQTENHMLVSMDSQTEVLTSQSVHTHTDPPSSTSIALQSELVETFSSEV